MATSDTNRPIPQNNAIVTSGLLSGFPDEADAVTGGDARNAFGMSDSPNIWGQSSLLSEISAQRQ
jgi:hypothetical protein